MNKYKLGDLVSFVPGINQTRAENQYKDIDIVYYDQLAFDDDFRRDSKNTETRKTNELSLLSGDIIISHTSKKAAEVSKKNEGKVHTINFIKVQFKDNRLDKHYFLYMFNSSVNVQKQKEMELRKNGLFSKLTLKSLENIEIPLPPQKKQEEIGKIYIETLNLKNKLMKKISLIEQATNIMLEKEITENNYEEN